ncbi:transcription initiation factor IIA subunit 2 [Tanacetum coccineum]|uniref:Transcription initiation factor IIA subunit 2 n=1 Tax=Tanacetum coccineum TaxID=301880 RepID=A0ABQ4WFP5_9ASTR
MINQQPMLLNIPEEMLRSPLQIRNVSPNEVFGNKVYGSDSRGFGVNPPRLVFRFCKSDEYWFINGDGPLNENLIDTLDEMVSTANVVSMAEALDNKVKTKVSIKGHLNTYRFCDNVWTFNLQDALIKYDESQENVGRVKIVACDSKLLT